MFEVLKDKSFIVDISTMATKFERSRAIKKVKELRGPILVRSKENIYSEGGKDFPVYYSFRMTYSSIPCISYRKLSLLPCCVLELIYSDSEADTPTCLVRFRIRENFPKLYKNLLEHYQSEGKLSSVANRTMSRFCENGFLTRVEPGKYKLNKDRILNFRK